MWVVLVNVIEPQYSSENVLEVSSNPSAKLVLLVLINHYLRKPMLGFSQRCFMRFTCSEEQNPMKEQGN